MTATAVVALLCLAVVAVGADCPVGNFLLNGECVPCPSGYISTSANAASCDACGPGTFAHVKECLPCPVGTFSASPAAIHCSVCGPGMVAPVEGSQACQPCPDNHRAVSSTVCVACPPNHYSNSSAGVCYPCPPGTQFTQGKCRACPIGYEAPFAGMPCQECEPGSFASTPGTVQCRLCERGFITYPGRTSLCIPCDTGLDTRWPGDDHCEDLTLSSDNIPDNNTVMTICFVFLAFLVAISVIIFAFTKCQ